MKESDNIVSILYKQKELFLYLEVKHILLGYMTLMVLRT